MILQFNPYPDELLYSALARYHILSRNMSISIKDTIIDVFNSNTVTAVVDFPNRLNDLYENLPPGSRFTPERIIRDHTLFPLFAPFLPKDRAENIVEKMKGYKDVHTTIGVMASGIPMPALLKYCPICFHEDELKYGESYWHRSHQVYGVNACPIHRVKLINSTARMGEKINKHEYTDITNAAINTVDNSDWDITIHDIQLAEDVQWLLDHPVEPLELEHIREKYKIALQRKGLSNFTGRLKVKGITKAFNDFYGQAFLGRCVSTIDHIPEHNWMIRLLRKPRTAAHPIRNLLLIRFLGFTPETFFNDESKYLPFGEGPWPCLNKAADHYLEEIVVDCKHTRDYDSGDPVGTFTCECGFVYCRRGPDCEEGDRFKIGNIRNFGPIWEQKVLYMHVHDGMNLAQIARILECDRITVRKYLNIMLGKEEPEIKETPKEFESERDDYRKQWLDGQRDYPSLSKTELRKRIPAAFVWLYRHDRSWLDEYSPALLPRKKYSDNRVDWQKRDLEILELAKSWIDNELQDMTKPPERISISMVGKGISKLSVLQKHPNKLPRSVEYIMSCSESLEDFQVRRVKYVAQQLRNESEYMMDWKIIRRAGLRPGYSLRVHAQIWLECGNNQKEP